MARQFRIRAGSFSDKGRKKTNQDYHGLLWPKEPMLSTKGMAVAVADGISSSQVSGQASKVAVTGFLQDYLSTPESWSVKKSGQCVLAAMNSWLYSQSQRSDYKYDLDKGYVCTFTGMIVKSSTAHIFHAGDSRLYRLANGAMEALTQEHRVYISEGKHYLKRAIGADKQIEFDYLNFQVEAGDTFLIMTDGIYEHVSEKLMTRICLDYNDDLDKAAAIIGEEALRAGSDDNLTIQIVHIDELPLRNADETVQAFSRLPFTPLLEPGLEVDGFKMIRQLYVSGRSHVFFAEDLERGNVVVFKVPASEIQGDSDALERFLMEEWVAKKINHPHVLRPYLSHRKRKFFYSVSEYIEGQTLAQWLHDHPNPSLTSVRNIAGQIAKGLQAFHRLEMIHQDLRPENILIDNNGTVKIIDFGSTWVAGLEELGLPVTRTDVVGTLQYTAPEYFLGEYGSARSDQFSLAVICYQLLGAQLPYGNAIAKATTRSAQKKLQYKSVLREDREIPSWLDLTLRKALQPEPHKRYEALTEFIFDLNHPNPEFVNQTQPPLLQRNPVLFWQLVSASLSIAVVYLLILLVSS